MKEQLVTFQSMTNNSYHLFHHFFLGSNSRASTPVSDRPALRPGKRNLADDEVSISSKDEEISNSSTTTPAPQTKEGTSTRKKGKKDEAVEESNVTDTNSLSILSDDYTDTKYSIDIPEELKYVLVNDWDLVVHQKQLFKLPAKVKFNLIFVFYYSVILNQHQIESKLTNVFFST